VVLTAGRVPSTVPRASGGRQQTSDEEIGPRVKHFGTQRENVTGHGNSPSALLMLRP
jgi:hypothetical protein